MAKFLVVIDAEPHKQVTDKMNITYGYQNVLNVDIYGMMIKIIKKRHWRFFVYPLLITYHSNISYYEIE